MHEDLDDYDYLVPKSPNKSKSYSADKLKNIQEERIDRQTDRRTNRETNTQTY